MGAAPNEASNPQPTSPARAAIDVAAVTRRDDFLLEFGAALGGQASVNPVDSVAGALEGLGDMTRPQILAIDTRDLGDVRAEVEAALARAPHLSVLVFVPEGTEKEAAASFKGSRIFAMLTLPVEVPKTAAVFEGAVAECRKRLGAIHSASAPSRSRATPAPETRHSAPVPEPLTPPPPTGGDDGAGRDLRPLIAGGVALAVVAAAAIWYLVGNHESAPPVEANSPAMVPSTAPADLPAMAADTSLLQGNVDDLLEKARLAMRERRYAEPTGDNALLYYRSALGAESDNGEAKDGLARVASVLAGRFDEALAANRHDEAATALRQLKNATHDDAYLSKFELRLTTAQVSKALADDDPDRAAALLRAVQIANSVPAAQLTRWNAEITRLREQSRKKQEAEQLARETAAGAQKEARTARAAAAAVAEQQAKVAGEQQALQEELKAEQAARAAQEAASAREAQAQADMSALRSRLKQKRYVAPEFPKDALAKNIGGVVAVAFTVDIEGATRDVRVESADPPEVFDRAAIAAVKRWRYEPPLLDGVPTEVPVRMAIRFAIPK